MELPDEIRMPGGSKMKYAVILIVGFILVGFGFEGYIPYGTPIAVSALIVGVLSIVLMARHDSKTKGITIHISEEGIHELKKYKETFISWAEYHQTYYDGTKHTIYMIPVATVANVQVVADGKRICVNAAPNNFQEKILQLSYQHILPELRQRLKKGVKVYFGPLELTAMSVILKNKEIRRDHINEVKIENGKLILKYDGSWFSTKILVSDIPNLFGLIELLSEGFNPITVKGSQNDVTM